MHNPYIYEKNLAALKQRYPDLAEKIGTITIDTTKYRIVKSKSGVPNIVIAKGLDFLMFYDSDDPIESSKNYLASLAVSYAPIVIFMGFGLGYHANLFMQHHGESCMTKKIIIFENDTVLFRAAMETIDLVYIISHPDIHLFVGANPEDVSSHIRRNILVNPDFFSFMRSTKVIPLYTSVMLDEKSYVSMLHKVKTAFRQQMVLAGNDPIDSLMGLENMLLNLKNIVTTPGINLLFDRFKGKPAITVASGPSLSKNMHLLKNLRDDALIISCDASFLPLMKRNIRPHIVCSMERTDGTEIFYEGMSDFDGMYLAFCPLVKPRTYDSFKGKKIIVNRPFSHFQWLPQDPGMLSFGPSVGNMAYKVAEALGCDPIILIGQDLAFADDGNTHVKEMPFGERDDFYHEKVLMVEGNNGQPVKTSRAWDIFRLHFEEDLQHYSGRCINATEGGAKIHGSKVMTLQDAIDEYCHTPFYPESIITEAISSFDNRLDVSKEYHAVISRIDKTKNSLQGLIKEFEDFHSEARTVQKNIIRPFILNGEKPDHEAMKKITNKFIHTVSTYLKDENIHNIMLHTLQPHLTWFANRLNFLPEVYSDQDCLLSAQVLMIKEWLGIIGQFLVSTELALIEGTDKFEKDIRMNYAVA